MKKNTLITLEEDLLEEVRTISKIEKRSLNGQINYFLDNSVMVWNVKQDKIREYANDYEKEEGKNE